MTEQKKALAHSLPLFTISASFPPPLTLPILSSPATLETTSHPVIGVQTYHPVMSLDRVNGWALACIPRAENLWKLLIGAPFPY